MNPLRTILALALVMASGVACAAANPADPDKATQAAPPATSVPAVTRPPPAPLTATAGSTSSAAPGALRTPAPGSKGTASPQATAPVPVYSYRVLNRYPHDPEAWTQGLVIQEGVLYEGTGLRERSSLRRVDLETGRILKQLSLPAAYFGEGVAVHGDRIYQLTWQSGEGFVYDRDSFELVDTFQYAHEGWGLTHDGERLIMSDGTETLHFLDPETLQETGTVQVMAGDSPVPRLNELEFINGVLYANVWPTSAIAQIDTTTGQVTGVIDLSRIYPVPEEEANVKILNGIAYDPESDRLFVTGKFWPTLFEIELVPVD